MSIEFLCTISLPGGRPVVLASTRTVLGSAPRVPGSPHPLPMHIFHPVLATSPASIWGQGINRWSTSAPGGGKLHEARYRARIGSVSVRIGSVWARMGSVWARMGSVSGPYGPVWGPYRARIGSVSVRIRSVSVRIGSVSGRYRSVYGGFRFFLKVCSPPGRT